MIKTIKESCEIDSRRRELVVVLEIDSDAVLSDFMQSILQSVLFDHYMEDSTLQYADIIQRQIVNIHSDILKEVMDGAKEGMSETEIKSTSLSIGTGGLEYFIEKTVETVFGERSRNKQKVSNKKKVERSGIRKLEI